MYIYIYIFIFIYIYKYVYIYVIYNIPYTIYLIYHIQKHIRKDLLMQSSKPKERLDESTHCKQVHKTKTIVVQKLH